MIWRLVLACVLLAVKVAPADPPPVEITAFVDSWLAAQNQGDFRAYQALYAERFRGVRRTGERTVRMSRPTWMKERARMFETKTAVTAAAIDATTAGAVVYVRFHQSWASGQFKDEGAKELVLARNRAGKLEITREQMLSSLVLTRSAKSASQQQRLRFVVFGGILVGDSEASWGSGPLTREGPGSDVAQAVKISRLPADRAALLQHKFMLFGFGDAPPCAVQVTGFKLVGRPNPDWDTQKRWNNLGTREKLREQWDNAEQHLLLATWEPASCTGTWARDPALPVPPVAPARAANAQEQAQVVAALHKLESYKAVQETHRNLHGKGHVEDRPPAQLIVWSMQITVRGQVVKLLAARLHNGEGCAYGAALTALWQVRNDRLMLVKEWPDEQHMFTAATDIDDDGAVDLLYVDPNESRGVIDGRTQEISPRVPPQPFYGDDC